MTIRTGINGSGGVFPQFRQDKGVEGAPGSSNLMAARPASNPILVQIDTMTVGGTATDGDYVFNIVEPNGTTTEIKFTRGSGESNADIGDELRDLVNESAALQGVVSATAAAGVVTLTYDHPGIPYSYSGVAAPAPGTLVEANTQGAGGSAVELARFYTYGAPDASGLPTISALGNSAAETDVEGILMRPQGMLPGDETTASQAPDFVDKLPAGGIGDLGYKGDVWVRNVGADAVPGGLVHVVRNTAGGQVKGQVRGDADAANTVVLSYNRARFVDRVPSGKIGRIYIDL